MGIAEVAVACGFTHQSHLNRHFKRLTGVTQVFFQVIAILCKNSNSVQDYASLLSIICWEHLKVAAIQIR